MPLPSRFDVRWWTEANEGRAHEIVHRVTDFLEEKQSARRDDLLRFMRLYGARNVASYSASGYSRTHYTSDKDRLSMNIIKSVIDACTAKIAKNRPRPMFLTERGNYSMKRRAKLLGKFTEGMFYKAGMYKLGPHIFRDGCVFGTGCAKIYEQDNEIKVDRVFPWELKVDHAESVYGQPRTLYQTKYVDRVLAQELFPKFKLDIESAKPADEKDDFLGDHLADHVCIVEAWHLPSTKDSDDGRHVIAVDNATLLFEKYKRDRFPFAFFKWSDGLQGFWGAGLAEDLIGIQTEINRLLIKIQRAFHLLGVARVFLEYGSKVVKEHFTNEVGSIVFYAGQPPIINTPQTIHPEVFAHLDRLYQRAYEIPGISQLSAQSRKPAGLDSRVALREFNDIESERFSIQGKDYEEFFMECARQKTDVAHDIAEKNGGKFEVMATDRKYAEKLEWEEVNLKRDAYVMRVFPTSALPSEPAGKTAMVEEWIAAGWIPPDQAPELLDFPDLEGFVSVGQVMARLTERLIELMIDKSEYRSPEPYYNLDFMLERVHAAYLEAQLDNVPEENLELLRNFISECKAMQKMAAPEVQDAGLPTPLGEPALEGAAALPPTPPGPEALAA